MINSGSAFTQAFVKAWTTNTLSSDPMVSMASCTGLASSSMAASLFASVTKQHPTVITQRVPGTCLPTTSTTGGGSGPSTTPVQVSVNPNSLSLQHSYANTPCPTPMGSLAIGETAPGPLNWSISGIPNWLTLSSTSGSLASTSNAYDVGVNFNCSVPGLGTYTATLTVTGTDASGSVTGTQQVAVTVTVGP